MPRRSSHPSRRALLGAAAGLVASGTFVPKRVYAQTSRLSLTTFRNSAKSWLWAPEDYTRALGLFDKYGVSVNSMVSNRGINITGVLGGDVDVSFGDPAEPINVRIQRQPVRMFFVLEDKWPLHIVIRKDIVDKAGVTERSPVATKAGLMKGLKIGHPGTGSGPDLMIRRVALLGGLNPQTDLQSVPITGAGQGMLAAVEQGQIDGFCFSSPSTDFAVKRNCAYLFEMTTNPPPELAIGLSVAAATTEKNLVDKRPALLAWSRAMISGYRAIHAEPDKFKAWTRTYLDTLEPDIFEAAFRVNFGIYPKESLVSEKLFNTTVEYLNTVNKTRGVPPIPDIVTYADAVDTSIFNEASRTL